MLGRKKKVEKNKEEKGSDRSLKGAIVGVAIGLVLIILNVNFMFFALVPFWLV